MNLQNVPLFQFRKALRRTSTKSHSFTVIAPQATAASSRENSIDQIGKELMQPSRLKLEAFAVRITWGFASVVFLLIALSLLLVVADYAGSAFGSDLQPKTVSSSSVRRVGVLALMPTHSRCTAG